MKTIERRAPPKTMERPAPREPTHEPAGPVVPGATIGLAWILTTSVGGGAGAFLACRFFPSAAFEVNPVGNYGWHLVGFAAAVGLGFAVPPLFVLASMPRLRTLRGTCAMVGWIPATAAGVMIMLLPLWDVLGSYLLFPPLLWLMAGPGTVVLALGQWALLGIALGERTEWLWRTVLGALAGMTVGLWVAGIMAPSFLEPVWAAITGLGMAALQAPELVRIHDRRRGGGPGRRGIRRKTRGRPAL